jgi:hypothetical protein
LSSKAICILICTGVHVGAGRKQNAGATRGIELRAYVQGRNSTAGGKGAQRIQFSLQIFTWLGKECSKLFVVVEQDRFEQRISTSSPRPA